MTEVRYIGMTFVYPKEMWNLLKAKAKIIEILVRKYECVSGYYTRKVGGVYLDSDRIMGWRYKKEVEFDWLPYFLEPDEYEIVWEESLEGGIDRIGRTEHWEKLGKRIEKAAFKSFPPKRYLDKYGVEYEKDRPAFPLGQKEGPEIEIYTHYSWYTYTGSKYFITLDFGTYENYFLPNDDERLNRAMDEFLVDLMRDIARETKPVYAYMNTEELKPLEYDPMCRNMKEMVKLVRRDGIYTVWSDILWVPKNAILNEFSMEELKIVEGVTGRKWEIVVEEHDDHLFLYPMKPISNYEYVEYRYKNRRKEEKLYRELELPMLRVCGDIEQGVYLDLSYLGEDALKKYRKRILNWSRKYGIRVINLE